MKSKKLIIIATIIISITALFSFTIYESNFIEENYLIKDGKTFLKHENNLYETTNNFRENFENASRIEDLIALERWHSETADPTKAGKQNNYYNQGSRLTITRDLKHSGESALKAYAPAIGETTKASIKRELLFLPKGSELYFSAQFFIENISSDTLAILDIESDYLYESPGIRIMLRGNHLTYELKAFNKKSYSQIENQEIFFPTNQWVHVRGHLQFSDKDATIELWQNDIKVIDTYGKTLPRADTTFNTFEVGITALGANSPHDQTLYVDDVQFSDKPLD